MCTLENRVNVTTRRESFGSALCCSCSNEQAVQFVQRGAESFVTLLEPDHSVLQFCIVWLPRYSVTHAVF